MYLSTFWLTQLPSARSSVASTSKYREDRAATASMLMSVSVSLKSSDEASSASASPAAWDAVILRCERANARSLLLPNPNTPLIYTNTPPRITLSFPEQSIRNYPTEEILLCLSNFYATHASSACTDATSAALTGSEIWFKDLFSASNAC